MVSVLLIGYGNELRGDDAIGRMAVERLHPLLPDSELASCHQLTPELAHSLAGCAVAIFVDATCDGAPNPIALSVSKVSGSSCLAIMSATNERRRPTT